MRRIPYLLLAALALGLSACGDDGGDGATASAASPGDVTLRVGVQKDGIRAVLDKTGALKDAPYAVEFSTFQFGPPLVEAAGADKIDLAWVGSTPPIFGAAARSDFKIVAAVKERDAQENSILVPPDSPMRRVEDLKGKKIAVPKGSSAHGLLLNALARVGLSGGDVTPVFLAPADALAAYSAGQVDALVIWDPFTIQAKQDLDARVITGGEPDEAGVGFLIASTKAIEAPAKRDAIADYIARLNRAWTWAGKHTNEWAKAWTEESKLPIAVTKATTPVKVSDIVPVDDTIVARSQKLADLLREEQVLPDEVDFESIVARDVVDFEALK
jgi:sulfonate transport system substrate-binding protein